MWALCGAVGKDQRRLSAASGPTCALRIIGGSRPDVSKIHGIESGNIDAQFHGRGAEQNRKESFGFSLRKHRGTGFTNVLLILRTEAKAPLAPLPPLGLNLRSMLPAFEA